ncbi:cytochrome b [Parvularcula flava]|uniref:Cytochrome b n=1 Tax=Aquisalinus luteolus TaxID=1566827 RepID=A0A8J3EPZ6_9PROT|nr:cytochrome b/b6 domain-containing protein [Aquisalinus luteolus]NHK26774.1 cytochrome b [Aquisalinus luteolus]GGH93370.1 cytochrome b [Aquisalinus luteolus]
MASLRDTKGSYGWISIALHWAGAASIIALYLLGDAIHDAQGREARIAAIWLHVGIAMLLYAIMAGWIVWRLSQRRPERVQQAKPLSALSTTIHWLLLALIVFQLISGPVTVWTIGVPIKVFDWFAIPGPFGRMPEAHDFIGMLHGWAARIILFAVIVHVLGALKHAIIDRDGTLMRMLKAGSPLKHRHPQG